MVWRPQQTRRQKIEACSRSKCGQQTHVSTARPNTFQLCLSKFVRIKRLLDCSPLCVAGGNGWFSCRVCLLSLLQQHIVENTSDVNVDIVLHALQNVHVGLYRVQKLGRLCYLRGFWTVHHHTSQCSGKPGLQVLVQVFPEAKLSFVEGYFILEQYLGANVYSQTLIVAQ